GGGAGGPPPLDGTLDGFELAEPLRLSLEDQYRRGEDAYPGPEDFSALAYAGWDETALYLAVQVTKPDLCLRDGAAPPLRLDNEVDDIHSDGLQIYIGNREARVGYLVVPDAAAGAGAGAGLRVHRTSDTEPDPEGTAVSGSWRRTPGGYRVTLGIAWPRELLAHVGARVGFDLIINEMLPGRTRRAGQLVWSGGNGWVWLRGDRQDPNRFGTLELVV
ncbi:MAG: sugar-binding protein, partial [Gemmatimonadales bacterium]